jgi:hypothetical protein
MNKFLDGLTGSLSECDESPLARRKKDGAVVELPSGAASILSTGKQVDKVSDLPPKRKQARKPSSSDS